MLDVEAHLLTIKAIAVANAHGGAHSNKVTVVPYPKVCVRVGKNALKLKDTTILVSVTASQYILGSRNANERPSIAEDPAGLDDNPSTGRIRCTASRASIVVRKRKDEGELGKSGTIKMARRATITVILPSI